MEIVIEESFDDGPGGPEHGVCRFRANAEEQWAQIHCRCGWEMMAGSIIELFEEYRDHTDVMVQMEKYLKEHDGNVSSEVESGSASAEGELPG